MYTNLHGYLLLESSCRFSHAAGFASRPCMYYVASSLASRDGTHAHCSMNIKFGVYSRAATITPDGRYVRRLFEGGYYSKCGVYSRKYGMCV